MKILNTLLFLSVTATTMPLKAQTTVPLMVGTNGTVAAPTNFWTANTEPIRALIPAIAGNFQPASGTLSNLTSFSRQITFSRLTGEGGWYRIIDYRKLETPSCFDGILNITSPDCLWNAWYYVAVDARGLAKPVLIQFGQSAAATHPVSELRASDDGNGHAAVDIYIQATDARFTVYGYGEHLPGFTNLAVTNALPNNQHILPVSQGFAASDLTAIGTVAGSRLSFAGGAIQSSTDGELTVSSLNTDFARAAQLRVGCLFLTEFSSAMTNGVAIMLGTGSPEGATTLVNNGSIYARVDGDSNSVLYVKTGGWGNTGWRRVLLESE